MAVDMLVSLAEAKDILRFESDDTESESRLTLAIGAASQAILRYLKSTGEEYRNTAGQLVLGNVPYDIRWATAALAGMLDQNPDGNEANLFERGWLPAPIESVLHSLREPTIA